jgi:hypothetical protein
MPENCQAATTPIVLTVSSPSARGRPFPRMEPGFQFPHELIDTTGQPDKLLIFGRAVKWFHLLDEYTSDACLDVPKPLFQNFRFRLWLVSGGTAPAYAEVSVQQQQHRLLPPPLVSSGRSAGASRAKRAHIHGADVDRDPMVMQPPSRRRTPLAARVQRAIAAGSARS